VLSPDYIGWPELLPHDLVASEIDKPMEMADLNLTDVFDERCGGVAEVTGGDALIGQHGCLELRSYGIVAWSTALRRVLCADIAVNATPT